MKAAPVLLPVEAGQDHSFHIRWEKASFFNNPWHYHPELELTMVIGSQGLRFVGDSIEVFEPGDLILLGSQVPHFWRNHQPYYDNPQHEVAQAIILRFRPDVFGKEFLKLPEMTSIQQLFERARHGLSFGKKAIKEVQPLLERLVSAKGPERLALWLLIFQNLAGQADVRPLSKKKYGGQGLSEEGDRLTRVLDYIHRHISDPIALADVAQIACMNEAAFCRFFKAQTRKTFTQVLTEVRIAYACRLLLESTMSISQVALEAGFPNFSHFYHSFRLVMGEAPSVYRKRLRNLSLG
ncbi:AraC family transcriptional regulator [Nibrella saemangeumensis]|uniref:AraC family transcriptional regulator n=1 Tax=Nibrella saemangeumensis TaxID=1084526 RepID=A0ABP8MTU2_9BACT